MSICFKHKHAYRPTPVVKRTPESPGRASPWMCVAFIQEFEKTVVLGPVGCLVVRAHASLLPAWNDAWILCLYREERTVLIRSSGPV